MQLVEQANVVNKGLSRGMRFSTNAQIIEEPNEAKVPYLVLKARQGVNFVILAGGRMSNGNHLLMFNLCP
jgi:hypothetical protein